MSKFIVIIAVCVVSLIVGLGNCKQLDNSIIEDEKNILLDIENVNFEKNIIEENIVSEKIDNENTLVNEFINNVKENSKNESNKDINKSTENNNKIVENKVVEEKEKVVKEDNAKVEKKQEVIAEEKIEQEVKETKEDVKENTIVQETKSEYEYNYNETQRLKSDIDKLAKENPDLFDENGNKLYRISEFINKEQAMNKTNYFSPYNILEIKGVVQNTYSCTFLVYAIDYKINGVLQQTRYYIKISEY